MGLEMVEFVMDVEDRFGIDIHESDFAGIETVGDLYRYVRGRVQVARGLSGPCPCVAGFYALRRALSQGLSVPSRSLSRDVRLETLLPRERRQEVWSAIGQHAGWMLPPLARSAATDGNLVGLGCLALVVMPLCVLVCAPYLPPWLAAWQLCGALIAAVALVWGLQQVAPRTACPPGITTVGDLIRVSVAWRAASVPPGGTLLTAAEVREAVLAIARQSFDWYPPESIHLGSRFEDLVH